MISNNLTSAIDAVFLTHNIFTHDASRRAIVTHIAAYADAKLPTELLTDLRSTIQEPTILSAIDFIIKLIKADGKMHFLPAGQHAEMHDKATQITLFVRENSALNAMWGRFLTMMNGNEAHNPGRPKLSGSGQIIEGVIETHTVALDFSPELLYLSDCRIIPSKLPCTTHVVEENSANIAKILEGVFSCEQDAFGLAGREQRLIQASKSYTRQIVVLDTASSQVLGSLFAINKAREGWTIDMVARRAHAAMRKVGDQLIQKLLAMLPNESITLGVRETSAAPARALYKKHGFEVVSTTPYMIYGDPEEREVTMRRPAAMQVGAQLAALKV